jgi:hypothetical protein
MLIVVPPARTGSSTVRSHGAVRPTFVSMMSLVRACWSET